MEGVDELSGGSGNDTPIGIEGDVFDGGSGDNVVIANPRSPWISMEPSGCGARIGFHNLPPGTYTFDFYHHGEKVNRT